MDSEISQEQVQEQLNDITRRIATGARIQTIIESMRHDLELLDELNLGDAADGSAMVGEVIGTLVPEMMQAVNMIENALDVYGVFACMDSGYRD